MSEECELIDRDQWIVDQMQDLTLIDMYELVGVSEEEALEIGYREIEMLVYDLLEKRWDREKHTVDYYEVGEQ